MSHRARKARERREAAQQRVEKRERHEKYAERQARLRNAEARRRDVDADCPHYLERDLGRVAGDLRVDAMPAVVRVRGMK